MSNTVNSVNLNKKLVDEFERLIAFIKQEQDKAYAEKNVKEANRQLFRLKTLRLALSVLKKWCPIRIIILITITFIRTKKLRNY